MIAAAAGPASGPRFLQLADVAEILNTSSAQVYALVRNGDLPAIKIGGRGQWRVEAIELEKYIARMYDETRDFVDTHKFGRAEDAPVKSDDSDEPAEKD
jgi:excisionase family DNA binding protein